MRISDWSSDLCSSDLSFRTPGVIVPQFVELPDGDRFFTISRTPERPVFSRDTQDRRLALSLGCELKHAHRLAYAPPFTLQDERLFSPIGINCHLCPRQASSSPDERSGGNECVRRGCYWWS